MRISVHKLNKSFGTYAAAQDVSFEIGEGRLIGLLGPSGGGKSTILRMLAGLEQPDSGDIYFDGDRVNDVHPRKRGIGFVFQNYALFKHMNVFDNIAFGLVIKKTSKRDIQSKVEELIRLTGLEGLAKRFPHQLSGGQRQRVAFARALAPKPLLLLLDEPFAAIDAKVRKELRSWLKEMIGQVGVTTVFVTHDQEEAVEIADEIIIVNRGRIEQQGTPIEIYTYPRTPFVASFVGESDEVADITKLKGFESGGNAAKAFVRPEFVEIGRAHELAMPSAAEQATVKNVFYRGTNWQVEVTAGSRILTAYRSLALPPLQPGEPVLALIHRLYLLERNQISVLENQLMKNPNTVFI